MNSPETQTTPPEQPRHAMPRTVELGPLKHIPPTNPSMRAAEKDSSKTLFQKPLEIENEPNVDRDVSKKEGQTEKKGGKTDAELATYTKQKAELEDAQAQARTDDVAVVSRLRERVWSDQLHQSMQPGDQIVGLRQKKDQTMFFGGNAAELLMAHANKLDEERRAAEKKLADRERKNAEKAQALAGMQEMNDAVAASLAQRANETAMQDQPVSEQPHSWKDRLKNLFN